MAGEDLTEKLAQIAQLKAQGNSPALIEMLESSESKPIRSAALEALGAAADQAAFDAFGRILQNDEDPLFDAALGLLEKRSENGALLTLAIGLSASNVFTRSRIVKAIAAFAQPSALTFLVRAARDHTDELAKMGRRFLVQRVRAQPGDLEKLRAEALAGVLDSLPFEEVRPFLAAKTAPQVRESAIARLGDCSEPQAVAFLLSACTSGDGPAAEAAMAAIEKNQHVPVEKLAGLLKTCPPGLYPRAFACYARRCALNGVAALATALRSETASVRKAAVAGLFRLLGEKSAPMITELLGDEDESVCLAVLDCLAETSPKVCEKPVILAALMGRPETQRRALALVAEKGIISPKLVDMHVAFLREALKDRRPAGKALDDICGTVAVLRHSAPPAAVELLVAAALSASPRLRRTAMDTLQAYPKHHQLMAYMGLIDAADVHVVTAVAFGLAEMESAQAIVPLIRVAAGAQGEDTRRATQYLKNFPELADVQELLRLLRSPHVAVKRFAARRLGELGQAIPTEKELAAAAGAGKAGEGAPATADGTPQPLKEDAANSGEIFKLIAMLQSSDQAVKREAVKKLSEIRDHRALDALLQAADDSDVEVQLAVVDALALFIAEETVYNRLIKFVDYGDVAVRMRTIEIMGEGKVLAAVDRLIAALGNVFVRRTAEEALRRIGDRRGYLAVLRRKKREALFPKKAKMEREKLMKMRGRRGGKPR